jgi:hypothetical protein
MNHGNNAPIRVLKFGKKPEVKRQYAPSKDTIEIPVKGGYRIQRVDQRNMDRYNEKKSLKNPDHEEVTIKFIPSPETEEASERSVAE